MGSLGELGTLPVLRRTSSCAPNVNRAQHQIASSTNQYAIHTEKSIASSVAGEAGAENRRNQRNNSNKEPGQQYRRGTGSEDRSSVKRRSGGEGLDILPDHPLARLPGFILLPELVGLLVNELLRDPSLLPAKQDSGGRKADDGVSHAWYWTLQLEAHDFRGVGLADSAGTYSWALTRSSHSSFIKMRAFFACRNPVMFICIRRGSGDCSRSGWGVNHSSPRERGSVSD